MELRNVGEDQEDGGLVRALIRSTQMVATIKGRSKTFTQKIKAPLRETCRFTFVLVMKGEIGKKRKNAEICPELRRNSPEWRNLLRPQDKSSPIFS